MKNKTPRVFLLNYWSSLKKSISRNGMKNKTPRVFLLNYWSSLKKSLEVTKRQPPFCVQHSA